MVADGMMTIISFTLSLPHKNRAHVFHHTLVAFFYPFKLHLLDLTSFKLQAAAAFMSRPNTTPQTSLRLGSIMDPLSQTPGSPSSGPIGNQHNLMSPGRSANPGPDGDHHRLREEVTTLRNKLQTWEESWNQAKQVWIPLFVVSTL